MPAKHPRIVVAIPARDEAELLPHCLAALARQTGIGADEVVVIVSCNNCSDDSPAMLHALAPALPFALEIEEVTLPPAIAHAGGARRHAMDAASRRVRPDGLILTTDADGIADDDWIERTASAFAGDIAAVAGRVSTDWAMLSQFPPDVLDLGAREWDYQLLSAELGARVDPEPHDPWPRHDQTCGANMAIRAVWYQRIGGLPVLRSGEDGAMFAAVAYLDGRIRHDMASHVTVSARLIGRAQGGMADALAARHGADYYCDDLLEPADDLLRRNRWRRAARAAYQRGEFAAWAHAVGIDATAAAGTASFAAAWAALEDAAPTLAKRRIAASTLDDELARLRIMVAAVSNSAVS